MSKEPERSSPSRTAGVCVRKITLAGTEFTLSQADKIRKAADEEAVIIGRRLDMLPAIARACMALPEEERAAWRRDYIATMIVGIASVAEWQAYYTSLWRLAFRFWNTLDPDHKGKRTLLDGVAWCYEIINDADVTKDNLDSLELAIEMVSQESEVSN